MESIFPKFINLHLTINVCLRRLSSCSILPAQPQRLCHEGEDVRVFQDGLGGRFPRPVPAARVHPDHQRLPLCRAAPHPVLQGSAVLEGVEGHHAVVVVRRQKQDGGVGRPRVGRGRQIVEGGVPWRELKKIRKS